MNALLNTDGNYWLDSAISALSGWVFSTGIKILVSLVIMTVCFRIIKKIARRITKKGESGKYDKTITKTLAYAFSIAAKTIVIVSIPCSFRIAKVLTAFSSVVIALSSIRILSALIPQV